MNENDAATLIGNYHAYASKVYDALEKLQSFMDEPKFQELVKEDSPELADLLDEACLAPNFREFLNELSDAMY